MTFNEEHSVIWEDAATLKVRATANRSPIFDPRFQKYFKHLMSDLPIPHGLPEYSLAASHTPAQNGKLKLRVPAPSQPSTNATPSSNGASSFKVKLPAAAVTASQQTNQPSRSSQQASKQASRSPNIATRPPPQGHSQAHQAQNTLQASTSYLHPATFAHVNPHQPQPQYQYHSQSTSQTQSAAHSISPSPLPPTPTPNIIFDNPLSSVTLKTLPLGRTLRLDSSEGVRTWVLRLGKGETTIDIRDVRFLETEETEEEDNDEGASQGNGDVIVKANGSFISAKIPNKREGQGVWEITELKPGTNILEVGERAGEIWKIVLQRIGVKS